ncbi:hypothetical protein EVAR_28816_1 [Eumeta japonica]|uniref:Uncharacterized protein n=1 Tax=Eumeta variegata TaxID=151549 RepID=A0A4C1WGR4_EUMVA|nr:hypothetical protein EVAR_28816_1 [Eumeta japonica]
MAHFALSASMRYVLVAPPQEVFSDVPLGHSEYGGFQPSTPAFGVKSPSGSSTSLTDLNASVPAQRYDANYYNSWSANTYNYNYQYNNINNNPACVQAHNPYINSSTPQVLVPNVFSTVNQNQIHVHLRCDKHDLEQYIPSEIKISDMDGGMEIGIGVRNAPLPTELQQGESSGIAPTCEASEDKHGLYGAASQDVWRPY